MVNKNWINTLFLFFMTMAFYGYCQKVPFKTFYYKADLHYGFIIEHRSNLGHLVKGHIVGAELNISMPSNGKNLWEYENNFPEKGLSLFWFNLANKEQLGNLFAISPHFEIPLHRNIGKNTLHMRVGSGIAFATKWFHPIENHKNNIISAPVNGFVDFKFMFQRKLKEKSRIDFGISLAHASNGKVRVPNLGLNLATLDLCYVFKTPGKAGNERNFPKYTDSSTIRPSKHELYGIAGFGFTDIYPVHNSRYFCQSYSLGYYLNVRNTHKWGLGVDVFYNPANKVLSWREDSLRVSTAGNIQVAVKIGWAYNIGRFSFPIEFGYYVKTTWKDDGNLVNRLGMRYYFKNNLFVSLGLKAHGARADYFEYGVGYRLPLKRKQSI